MKDGRGNLIGNAGEHFVMAELLRHDIVAALAPRNAPGIDILADAGKRTYRIRVKTKSHEAESWVWMAKEEDAGATIFPGLMAEDRDHTEDLIALVDVPEAGAPMIHLLSTPVVDRFLKKTHQEYLDTPGRGGRKHQPSRMRRFYPGEDLENLSREAPIRWNDLRG